MRKLTLALFFAVLSCAFAQDLVGNGGFKQGEGRFGTLPPEWRVEPANGSGWRCVNDDGYMGGDDAAESVLYTHAPNAGALAQTVKCQRDTEYVLSAALKTKGCVPKVEVVAPDGKILATLQGSADRHGFWKRQQANFKSGNNQRLTVRLVGSAATAADKGKSGIDQVSVLPAALAKVKFAGEKPFVPPGENIALDKPYTMKPAPRYTHCTDPGDKTQLTDGEYSVGYFWTQKSTVGWVNAMPVVATIDLGREEPISGVSWNTAAGVAGVTWPTSLQIYVSGDQKNWAYQGDLVTLGTKNRLPSADKYGVFKYATDGLKTKGRWVQFLLHPGGSFAFCDEIEVFRGQDAWLAQSAGQEVVVSPVEYFWHKNLVGSIKLRLLADLNEINASLAGLPPRTEGLAEAKLRVPQLQAEIRNLPEVKLEGFQSILPLNPTHEAIYALNALGLRAAGFRRPFFWRNNRWENLSLTAIPPTGAEAKPLQVAMMRNEVRGETVNITNPTDEAVTYVLKLRGLPTDAACGLREVLNTDTRQSEPIGAALKATDAADGSLHLRVPAGCTRQVWLSFRHPRVADGHYRGHLTAVAAGQPTLSVEVNLRVMGQFPAAPTLHVGGWDYVNGSAAHYRAPGNLQDNLAMMRDMYVDSPWATNAVIPKGAAFDAGGKLTNADKLDFANWDEWVRRWGGARQYCVFWAVRENFMGEDMGTPRFNRMVADLVTAWTSHLKKTGLKPNQLVVLLLDEPRNNDQDRIIIAWAKAIKAANTGLLLFEDPIHSNPEDGLPEMYALCDVLCPNTPTMLARGEKFKDFYLRQQAAGRELWLYSCSGPAKLLDPVTYHRAQNWRAFEIGAKGSFYWALGCGGGQGDSWNAYTQPGTEYSPYFVSKTTVMDGKHSEAVREGVQDYEYLLILKNKIAAKKQAGQMGPAVEQAEKLLAEAPARALASVRSNALQWKVAKDRSLMDQVRIEVLEAIEQLK